MMIKPKVTSKEVEEMLEKLSKKVEEKYQNHYSLLVKRENRYNRCFFILPIIVLGSWLVSSITAGFSFSTIVIGLGLFMIVIAVAISAVRNRVLGEIEDFLESVYDDLESAGICTYGDYYPSLEDRLFGSEYGYGNYKNIRYYITGIDGYFGRYLKTIKTLEEYTKEEPPSTRYYAEDRYFDVKDRPDFNITINKLIKGVKCTEFIVYAHGEYEFESAVGLDFSYVDEAYKKAEALVSKYCVDNESKNIDTTGAER